MNELLTQEFAARGEELKKQLLTSIQAQYRGTNLDKLIQGILEIRIRHIVRAYESLIRDNLSLTTASGDGLDLWGVILGLSRYILIEASDTAPRYYTLTDDEYRVLLIVLYQKQYISLNTHGANAFVKEVLADYGDVRISDTNDMSYIIYEFTQTLPEWLRFVLIEKDILPRPAGVGIKIQDEFTSYPIFGFAASAHDKTSNPAKYAARVEWFKNNIWAFNSTFGN